jgi:hypothetical protein
MRPGPGNAADALSSTSGQRHWGALPCAPTGVAAPPGRGNALGARIAMRFQTGATPSGRIAMRFQTGATPSGRIAMRFQTGATPSGRIAMRPYK